MYIKIDSRNNYVNMHEIPVKCQLTIMTSFVARHLWVDTVENIFEVPRRNFDSNETTDDARLIQAERFLDSIIAQQALVADFFNSTCRS